MQTDGRTHELLSHIEVVLKKFPDMHQLMILLAVKFNTFFNWNIPFITIGKCDVGVALIYF